MAKCTVQGHAGIQGLKPTRIDHEGTHSIGAS